MEKTVTIEQVLDWRPCYTREQVEELFDGRETMWWRDIAALPISAEHRSWALIHDEFIDGSQLYLLGADIAELVLPIYEERYPGDHRPRNAIEAARQFARGEIDENQRKAARSAVWFASRDESLVDASRSEAMAAFWAVDCNAWFAARSTSSSASWFAVSYAARTAAWEQILQIICNHLEE